MSIAANQELQNFPGIGISDVVPNAYYETLLTRQQAVGVAIAL